MLHPIIDIHITESNIVTTPDPLPLAAIKGHLNIYHDAQDTLLEDLRLFIIAETEKRTQCRLTTRTVVVEYDGWPIAVRDKNCTVLNLPVYPVTEVTEIRYFRKIDGVAGTGTVFAASNYRLVDIGNLPKVVLKGIVDWPTDELLNFGLRLTCVAGYNGNVTVSRGLRNAMLVGLAACYLSRDNPDLWGYSQLINNYCLTAYR